MTLNTNLRASDLEVDLEEQTIRAYVGALAILDPLRIEFWDSAGLTLPQLRLIFLLKYRDGRTVSELAEIFNVRVPTMTRLIDRVEHHGLLRRAGDHEDRRVTRLYLTAEGINATRAFEAAARGYLSEVFARLGRDRLADLNQILREMRSAARDVARETELRV